MGVLRLGRGSPLGFLRVILRNVWALLTQSGAEILTETDQELEVEHG